MKSLLIVCAAVVSFASLQQAPATPYVPRQSDGPKR